MARNFTNFVKYINLQIQEVYQIPNRNKIKTIHAYKHQK